MGGYGTTTTNLVYDSGGSKYGTGDCGGRRGRRREPAFLNEVGSGFPRPFSCTPDRDKNKKQNRKDNG